MWETRPNDCWVFSKMADLLSLIPIHSLVAAPFLWNSLPLEVKSSPSLNIFKSKLKTHLFKCAFNLN